MQAALLWSGICFKAEGGQTERLMQQAAAAGLRLYGLVPCPGGFEAACTARHYLRLRPLARRCRLRLRVQKRHGLFFALRPWLRRTGLWVGLAVFLPLLAFSQRLVWSVDAAGLTTGQRARVQAALYAAHGLGPGCPVSEALLRQAEHTLLQQGEFAWVSLHFFRGRLSIEAAAAVPVPDIAAGDEHGLWARTGGTVTAVNLASGTALVAPGQQVQAGQLLIGTARQQRDGGLVYEPAAGSVTARFVWQCSATAPLAAQAVLPGSGRAVQYTLCAAHRQLALPALHTGPQGGAVHSEVTRFVQLRLLGLPLPATLRESTRYLGQAQTVRYTRRQAQTIARAECLRALHALYPDAELLAREETAQEQNGILHYAVRYIVQADICG